MAATAAGVRLTEAHRLAQHELGIQTVRQITTSWRLVDPRNLDDTVEAWLRAAVPAIRSQKAASARLAALYLRTYRSVELGPGRFVPALADSLDVRQAITSLTVTGPVKVKQATAHGIPLAQAGALGRDGAARAAMRLALAGGRATIVDSVRADSQALGWARATSGQPCHFCAALASRGPAYSEESVGFEAHDGCSCTAEPVYSADADWPSGSRRYREIWDEATRGEPDQLNAFRRALAG